jgi:putative membrane protein
MMKMNEKGLFAMAGVMVVALAFIYLTGGGTGFMMGPGMMGSWALGGGGLMGLGMVVFWIFLLAGLYLLVTNNRISNPIQYNRALAIAQERFARGEITQEEFERIKESLSRI